MFIFIDLKISHKTDQLFPFFCIVCSPGQYGKDCSDSCSGYCINKEPCDHVSGVCTSGCQDGFVGTRCYNCNICLLLK